MALMGNVQRRGRDRFKGQAGTTRKVGQAGGASDDVKMAAAKGGN